MKALVARRLRREVVRLGRLCEAWCWHAEKLEADDHPAAAAIARDNAAEASDAAFQACAALRAGGAA